MKNKGFLRSMKRTSRILITIWLFICLLTTIPGVDAETGEDITNLASTVLPFYTVLLLIPVFTIELCSNPLVKSSTVPVFRFLAGTRVISRVIFDIWFILVYISIEAFTVPEDFFVVFGVLNVFFLIPVVIVECITNRYLKEKRYAYNQAIERQRAIYYPKRLENVESNSINKELEVEELSLESELDEEPAYDLACEEDDELLSRADIYNQRYGVDVFDINSIDYMDGHTFEYFCADLLVDNGYLDVEVTRGSGDQGADIIATNDGVRLAIQCKHKENPLASKYGNKPIQEVYAGMSFYKCDEGIVLTNGYFSDGGKMAAEATGVELWDRGVLAELLEGAGFIQGHYREEQEISTIEEIKPEELHIRESFGLRYQDGVEISVDEESFEYYHLAITDVSVYKDFDPKFGYMEVMLDINSTGQSNYRRNEDVVIVCNVYSKDRKLDSDTYYVNHLKFRKMDSISLEFNKDGICKNAKRIMLFCKEP